MRELVSVMAVAVAAGTVSAGKARAQGQPGRVPLSLAQAVQQAAARAPAVQEAGYQVDQSAAQAGQTRSELLPSLSATGAWFNHSVTLASTGFQTVLPPGGGLSFPSLIGPYSNLDARLRVTQSLVDLSGWERWRAARIGTEGSRAERDATIQGAAVTAALAYLQAVQSASLLAARRQDAELAAELQSLAESQLAAGVSTPLDLTRSKTQAAEARSELLVAENARRKADITLALALGQDPATRYALTDTLSGDLGTSAASADTTAALDLALRNRPDLAAVVAQGDRARAERRAIATERLPRLDFAADFGPNGSTLGSTINTRDLALEVTVPLLNGFRREAQSAEQTAVERASDVRAADLRRHIAAQVRAALLDLASGAQEHDVAVQRLALAEEELSQARARFESGVTGNIDVINAQVTLNQARDAEINTRFATAAARVQLAYAAGAAVTIH